MSEPLRLWPEKQTMRKNLENWIQYIDDMGAALAEEARRHQEDNERNNEVINQLQAKVRELEVPLKERIVYLERELVDTRATLADREAYLKAAGERLARALEDPGAARTTSFAGLMDQVVELIEDSKRIIQENL